MAGLAEPEDALATSLHSAARRLREVITWLDALPLRGAGRAWKKTINGIRLMVSLRGASVALNGIPVGAFLDAIDSELSRLKVSIGTRERRELLKPRLDELAHICDGLALAIETACGAHCTACAEARRPRAAGGEAWSPKQIVEALHLPLGPGAQRTRLRSQG